MAIRVWIQKTRSFAANCRSRQRSQICLGFLVIDKTHKALQNRFCKSELALSVKPLGQSAKIRLRKAR
ncbi:MAG: hypothetical protein ACKO96_29865, partial [Flammeovirgaceae bacterium]